jgi:hypothetical protein
MPAVPLSAPGRERGVPRLVPVGASGEDGGAADRAAQGRRGPGSMELLTLEHFAGCVNETFSADLNDMSVEFVLVEARPIADHAKNPARAPFSLLFRNTAPILFPQQIYTMHHPRVGDVGIFLVPVAQERAGFLYQAVFN